MLFSGDCNHCELRKNAMAPVWGHGNPKAEIMIVGEAPGKQEDYEGQPFVGRSGEVLDRALQEAGINRSEVYITNVVKCRPVSPTGGNMAPPDYAVAACSLYLTKEISQIKPKVIVVLGRFAAEALGVDTKYGITKMVGSSHKTSYGTIVVNIHPSYVLRNGMKPYDSFASVFMNLFGSDAEKSNTKIITTMEAFEDVLDGLAHSDIWAFDTEGILGGKACGLSFAWENSKGVYIPLYELADFSNGYKSFWGNNEDYVLLELQSLFANKTKKVAHNALYDMRVLWKSFGWKVSNVWMDTMLALNVINSDLPSNLEYLSRTYDDLRGYYNDLKRYVKRMKVDVNKFGYFPIPLDIIGPYSARDSDLTLRLFHRVDSELKNQQRWLVYCLLMPALRMLAKMERIGVGIDEEYVRGLFPVFDKRVKEIESLFYFTHGIKVGSPKELSSLLFDTLGVTALSNSERTGNPSTDSNSLKKILEGEKISVEAKEALELVLEYRDLQKNRDTYLTIPDQFGKDGRIYPEFQIMKANSREISGGTVSGRVTVRNPGLQTMPRKSEIKRMIVPQKGTVMFMADYKGMEVRFLAYLSQDEVMLDALEKGLDLHRLTASKLFRKDFDLVTDEERQLGKSIVFALLYGGGVKVITSRFPKLSEEDAVRYIKDFFDVYQGMAQWRQNQIAKGRADREVFSIFGRRWSIDPTDKTGKWRRQCLNYPIQSGASDFCLYSMVRCDKFFTTNKIKARNVLQVYDSVEIEIMEDQVTPEVVGGIIKNLESPIDNVVDYNMIVDTEMCYHLGVPLDRSVIIAKWGKDVSDLITVAGEEDKE